MDTEEPVIKFRNYKPATEEFKTQIIPSAPAEHSEDFLVVLCPFHSFLLFFPQLNMN